MTIEELKSLSLNESPASFRVIGVGHGIENVINEINSFGFEGVSAEVVKYPFDCTPQDEDKLAIICFTECDDNANRIAKTVHDAGVLTIGIGNDIVPSCYDSVMQYVSSADMPDIIKTIVHPMCAWSYMCYDFNDINWLLRDSDYFIAKSFSGKDVNKAIEDLRAVFENFDLNFIDGLHVHFSYNPNRPTPLRMSDIISFRDLKFALSETITVMYTINYDEKLNGDEIRLSAILAGKEVWRCQGI